jgi:hypothetical protein
MIYGSELHERVGSCCIKFNAMSCKDEVAIPSNNHAAPQTAYRLGPAQTSPCTPRINVPPFRLTTFPRISPNHTSHNMSSLQDGDVPPIEDVEAGVMGLTEVDPSPVEETPIEYREKSYFPDQTQGESWGPGASGVKRTGTLGLKLGDHGVVWWCTSAIPLPHHLDI